MSTVVLLSFSLYHPTLQYGSNEEYDANMKCSFLGLYFNFCNEHIVSYGQYRNFLALSFEQLYCFYELE